MANIFRRQRLETHFSGDPNGPAIVQVDGDPSAGSGTVSEAGTIAIYTSGSVTKVYIKNSEVDTDWDEIQTQGGGGALDAIKLSMNYAGLTQNDDGGWNFSDVADSTPVRDRTDVSFNNQFGTTPICMIRAYELSKEASHLESARGALEAWVGTAVDPFNRFFPDITEALVTLGSEGPLQFTDYLNKGQEAADAEINFYKTIQRWHDLGNGPNPNPPVGTGADGNLLDLWTNDNAACVAVSLEDAAQRLVDRIVALRPVNIRAYDLNFRMRLTENLSAIGKTINGEDYQLYATKIANEVKDTIFPALNFTAGPGVWWPVLGYSHCVLIFKRYEAEAGFSVVLQDALDQLKEFRIQDSSTPEIDGFYGVDNPIGSESWFSGDKLEQAYTLQALVAADEDELALDLAQTILLNQQPSGNWSSDIFDILIGPISYSQEANATTVCALIDAIEANII